MTRGRLNGKKKWIGAGAAVLSATIAIVGWVWAASASKTKLDNRVDQCCKQLDDHECRMRDLEKCTYETRQDIRWIRSYLERQDKIQDP